MSTFVSCTTIMTKRHSLCKRGLFETDEDDVEQIHRSVFPLSPWFKPINLASGDLLIIRELPQFNNNIPHRRSNSTLMPQRPNNPGEYFILRQRRLLHRIKSGTLVL